MKKTLSLFLLFLCIVSLSYAQKSREQMGGVYYAYPTPQNISYTKVPDGYHAFYISHYGRHGSRWVTSDSRYEWVNSQFADDSNLTKLGKSLKKRLAKVWNNAKGNGGKLTALGAAQHRGIADRMYANFPEVFNGNKVTAHASIVGRCVKSMQSFSDELNKQMKGKTAVQQTADSIDLAWIAYESPELKALSARTKVKAYINGQRFAAALFKDPSKIADADKLMGEIHTIASDMQDVELKVKFDDVINDEECRAVYEQNNERMWICNGQSPDNYGAPSRSAFSLWNDIETRADNAVANGGTSADLRFGHDTALYHLMSLLGISTLSDERVDKMDEVVPMAANLQMIFYTNGKNVIVKLMLNEHEVKLFGLRQESPYFQWETLKKYVHKRMQNTLLHGQIEAINTMVGTDFSVIRNAGAYGNGKEEHGQTLPAAFEPNGMNFWTPQTQDTEQKCLAPYYYGDKKFQGFRASHWMVGGCTQDYGSFTLMPEMDVLRLKPEERASRFSHDDEISHPDYYSVVLPDEHLKAEMTGMSHTAMFRFKYNKSGKAYFVVNPNSDKKEGFVAVDTVRNCIYGYNPVHRIYQGWGEKAGFSGWFAVQFEDPIVEYGVKDTVAYVAFNVNEGDEILAKASTSFVDMKGVFNNIAQEVPHWEFYDTRCRVVSSWQSKLAKVIVESSDTVAVNKFYGALYRASFLPRAFSDKDGRYPSFAGGKKIMQHSLGAFAGRPIYRRVYQDFSMWDTYRALCPLNIIIDSKTGGYLQSLVDMYQQGGWLPIFPAWNSYTAAMIGDHCSAALAEGMVKNVSGFDEKIAYEAMRKNAFESPKTFDEYKNGMGRRALKSYLKYGYIPMEDSVMEAFHTHEQVSRTLEYAYDDYALAQAAKVLGKMDDYKLLMKRAANWRNVINPVTGWADGRYMNGKWLGNKDILTRVPFITEGAAIHYSFYVPHDVYGLIKVMGGKDKYVSKLDYLFGISSALGDSAFTKSYYWHGNEPCHQIPYMYAYAGEPWKTQRIVRHILDNEYLDVPGGLSGNDDAGQMSAWYMFSAMGFYPVCPASQYYVIGTPTFKKVTIGNFMIETENVSDKNFYIQSATYNGKPYTHNYITHEMVKGDGVLKFVMGPNPNKNWGSASNDCPPDLMK